MKNLVYLCCFLNKNYIRFLELLFGSIVLFSKESIQNIDFLVITQVDFADEIKKIGENLGINIFILILEKPYKVFLATTLRYEIFNWENIKNYEKSLYLDTDILVHGELDIIFRLASEKTKLYTLQEGTIDHEYWGGHEIFDFQGEDKEIDPKIPGFCSGVLLFYNTKEISDIFQMGKAFMLKKLQIPGSMIPICYDQPYFNYICAKHKLNINNILNNLCINRAPELLNDYIIYHFPETTFTIKYTKMILMMIDMLKNINPSHIKDKILEYLSQGRIFLHSYDEFNDLNRKF